MTVLTFPSTPSDGDIYNRFKYNATRGVWERFNYAIISGGTETTYTDANGQDWKAHIFTTSGTLTVSTVGMLDTLCLGGGGSASSWYGHQSQGGAGAARWGWFEYDTTGDYSIVVGGDTKIIKPNSTELLLGSGYGTHGSGRNDGSGGGSQRGGGGSGGGFSRSGGTQYGGGAGGLVFGGGHETDGVVLDYETGSPREYAHGGDNRISVAAGLALAPGSGGGNNEWSSSAGGKPGLVVVRYKI